MWIYQFESIAIKRVVRSNCVFPNRYEVQADCAEILYRAPQSHLQKEFEEAEGHCERNIKSEDRAVLQEPDTF